MKYIFKITLCILFSAPFVNGQSLNWSQSDSSSSHMVYLNFGYDFGAVTEIGYGYRPKKDWPLWAQVDFSQPMGGDQFDDFKARAGFQLQAFSYRNFAVIARLHATYRAHQNDFAGMKSWGSEASAAVGWYGSKWLVEWEVGFDKAIITQLNHTDAYRENYADVQDGWYIPAGGQWFYGIKAGRTFGKNLIASIELGATNAQGSDKNAFIPRYFTIGLLKPL